MGHVVHGIDRDESKADRRLFSTLSHKEGAPNWSKNGLDYKLHNDRDINIKKSIYPQHLGAYGSDG